MFVHLGFDTVGFDGFLFMVFLTFWVVFCVFWSFLLILAVFCYFGVFCLCLAISLVLLGLPGFLVFRGVL